MNDTEVSLGTQTIHNSERTAAELQEERVALRGFKPGDPERERRIAAAMERQGRQSLEIQSVQGRARWHDDLLTDAEYARLSELSRTLTKHRRQLKKMRR